ncbi:2-dehydro-3-deoxygalactonokinase [Ancylobacter amanitiformis]|uniref:2-dehydro-3-deoxygalactonokinase n=1 Tax=Ancylobacter amanitiformis TaxID=217069 RepID=A0ABU0LVI9_9HYPH|nr:2-dehydro-3-deoxygalactonokinase [Ancylobacter amanitiformis]MDQ0512623.1 2-dehydro-3-deoxygalactonokinase [Ancylobacter amanitiformis]
MGTLSHVVVDWGTSSFRLWALDRTGHVLGERRSAQGLAASAAEGFEAVLESHLAALGIGDGVSVMMCGMVGSRSGWVEAAYLDAPVRLDELAARGTHVPSARRLIHILPGIAQRDPIHPDVIRGEETQLLALARRGHDGLACLPGTHGKWVQLTDGAVARFVTFMTGELFQLLRERSVLAPALQGGAPVDPSSPDFSAGVADALAAPASIGNALFALRAGWLLADRPADAALARLSGLLIGLEIAGARERLGAIAAVTLIASGPSAALYRQALAIAGLAVPDELDAEDCVRRGLHEAALIAFRLERVSR